MNTKMLLTFLQIRKFSMGKVLNKRRNHYESLGLSSGATQADIKSAYYEMSKVYHPDKNQGNEQQQEQHSQKFRDITEAYEVLGNVKTRKLYDKGFMDNFPQSTQTHSPMDDRMERFYRSRTTRTRPRPPTSTGKTPIYDFDEWSRQHYRDAFQRSQEMKSRHALNKKKKEVNDNAKIHESFLYGLLLLLILCMVYKELTSFETRYILGPPVNKKEP